MIDPFCSDRKNWWHLPERCVQRSDWNIPRKVRERNDHEPQQQLWWRGQQICLHQFGWPTCDWKIVAETVCCHFEQALSFWTVSWISSSPQTNKAFFWQAVARYIYKLVLTMMAIPANNHYFGCYICTISQYSYNLSIFVQFLDIGAVPQYFYNFSILVQLLNIHTISQYSYNFSILEQIRGIILVEWVVFLHFLPCFNKVWGIGGGAKDSHTR